MVIRHPLSQQKKILLERLEWLDHPKIPHERERETEVIAELQILHAAVSGLRVIICVRVRGLRGCDCEQWSGHLAANGASLARTMKFVHKVDHASPRLVTPGFIHHHTALMTSGQMLDCWTPGSYSIFPRGLANDRSAQNILVWKNNTRKMVAGKINIILSIWLRCPLTKDS